VAIAVVNIWPKLCLRDLFPLFTLCFFFVCTSFSRAVDHYGDGHAEEKAQEKPRVIKGINYLFSIIWVSDINNRNRHRSQINYFCDRQRSFKIILPLGLKEYFLSAKHHCISGFHSVSAFAFVFSFQFSVWFRPADFIFFCCFSQLRWAMLTQLEYCTDLNPAASVVTTAELFSLLPRDQPIWELEQNFPLNSSLRQSSFTPVAVTLLFQGVIDRKNIFLVAQVRSFVDARAAYSPFTWSLYEPPGAAPTPHWSRHPGWGSCERTGPVNFVM